MFSLPHYSVRVLLSLLRLSPSPFPPCSPPARKNNFSINSRPKRQIFCNKTPKQNDRFGYILERLLHYDLYDIERVAAAAAGPSTARCTPLTLTSAQTRMLHRHSKTTTRRVKKRSGKWCGCPRRGLVEAGLHQQELN